MVHKIKLEICIGANKHTRLGMTNRITITGQAYAPSVPPPLKSATASFQGV